MSGGICVSVCGKTLDEVVQKMTSARAVADVIEIRFDCLDPDHIEPLIDNLIDEQHPILVTFRPAEQGGRREISRDDRIAFWDLVATRLKKNPPLVDHEFDIDFDTNIEQNRIIGSFHNFDPKFTDLSSRFEDLQAFPSSALKIAISVGDAAEAVDVWKAHSYFSRPVIPIAMGEAGKWTRILGLAHGAPLTYASLEPHDTTAPGQISAIDLRDIFRVKELTPASHVYAVIAGETSYSLSPYMHNAAFRRADVDAVFVPMQVHDLDAFMRRMVQAATREVELNFRGFAVTNPHKQTVIKYLDTIDDAAGIIGAVNTIKIDDGKLHGYNTDADGFIAPLASTLGDIRDARVSVVGAGGAARACVYALKRAGATVTVIARDIEKTSSLADEFGVKINQLKNGPLRADVLVNTTPLGTRGPSENETIATADQLRDVRLVYDLVYNPTETRLLREANAAGAKTIGGLDMLIGQGAKQFEIWTGLDAPAGVMRSAIEERLQ